MVAAATAVAAGGAVGVASQIDDNKEELQQQAAQTAREAIANVTSSVAEKVEQKTSENPMVGMIRKNFGQSLIQAGYSVPELTKMLDVDADGIITHAEIMLLIVKMTGTPPPPWVVTSIFEILDANQDGVVTVAEWHGFLEEMGFESTIISSPTPAVVTEEIEEVYDELDTLEENIPPVQIIEDPIPTPVTEEISIDSANGATIFRLGSGKGYESTKEVKLGALNDFIIIPGPQLIILVIGGTDIIPGDWEVKEKEVFDKIVVVSVDMSREVSSAICE